MSAPRGAPLACAWCGHATRCAATMRGPDGRFGLVPYCTDCAPPGAPA